MQALPVEFISILETQLYSKLNGIQSLPNDGGHNHTILRLPSESATHMLANQNEKVLIKFKDKKPNLSQSMMFSTFRDFRAMVFITLRIYWTYSFRQTQKRTIF